jgi:hypothetical protein
MPYKNFEAARRAKREWARAHRAAHKAGSTGTGSIGRPQDVEPPGVEPGAEGWTVRAVTEKRKRFLLLALPAKSAEAGTPARPRLCFKIPASLVPAIVKAVGGTKR